MSFSLCELQVADGKLLTCFAGCSLLPTLANFNAEFHYLNMHSNTTIHTICDARYTHNKIYA